MNAQELYRPLRGTFAASDKGLLATDESNLPCNKRFAGWGIPQIEGA